MTTPALTGPETTATWTNICILVGSGIFVLCLAVAAAFVPEIRALHALQALIYVAIIVLTRKKSAWGFGAGVVVAVFWNYLVLVAAPIGREGIQALGDLIRTGHAQHADRLLQLVAGCGHVLIIVGCLVGLFRTRPGARQWGQFVGGGVLVIGYLVAIIFATAPPDIVAHLKDAFGR